MLQLARQEDRLAVETLAHQVHALHVAWRPELYEMVDSLYSPARFDDSVRNRQLYVAKIGGDVVGYVRITTQNYDYPGLVKRKVMILEEIGVREDCRSTGIGTQIMDDVKALAKAFGCRDLQLGVYPQNDEAVAFYQKNGLTIRNIEMQMKL